MTNSIQYQIFMFYAPFLIGTTFCASSTARSRFARLGETYRCVVDDALGDGHAGPVKIHVAAAESQNLADAHPRPDGGLYHQCRLQTSRMISALRRSAARM